MKDFNLSEKIEKFPVILNNKPMKNTNYIAIHTNHVKEFIRLLKKEYLSRYPDSEINWIDKLAGKELI